MFSFNLIRFLKYLLFSSYQVFDVWCVFSHSQKISVLTSHIAHVQMLCVAKWLLLARTGLELISFQATTQFSEMHKVNDENDGGHRL